MYTGLHVQYPLFLSDFNEGVFSRPIFEKYSNIKFHEIPSNGSELFDADGRTGMTKLRVAFRTFANAPKNEEIKRC